MSEEYVRQLEDTVTRITMERDSALSRVHELEKEREQLLNRLKLYENPHTPPSRQMIRPKITNPPGKRGDLDPLPSDSFLSSFK